MSEPLFTARLQGDRDIVEAFRDLRDYLPKTALRSAVRDAATFLQYAIALAAPKLTGRLSRNIVVKTKKTAETIRARVIVNTRGKEGDESNAFYWRFLEEGFHTRSGEFRKFPFIAAVFNSLNVAAAQRVIDACGKAIERAEKKANKS